MGQTKLSFTRYEKKYLLSPQQYGRLWAELEAYIEPDEHPHSTVCSLYYDSADFALIRHSIDAPVYKEKLRVRSYNVPGAQDMVFVELKKKFKGVVYKRRVEMGAAAAAAYLEGAASAPENSQMMRELDWFLKENSISKKMFIACDRNAFRAKDNHELRVTFDRDIRWRDTELELTAGSHGAPLLEDDQVLMEIKSPGAMPMWLARMLSEQGLFPQGFSKYGHCYKDNVLKKYIFEVDYSA